MIKYLQYTTAYMLLLSGWLMFLIFLRDLFYQDRTLEYHEMFIGGLLVIMALTKAKQGWKVIRSVIIN